MALLDVKDLKTYFRTDDGIVKAVDGVSFNVEKGKTLGIVGESGCGKSVTTMSLLGLLPPTASVEGEARFNGGEWQNVTLISGGQFSGVLPGQPQGQGALEVRPDLGQPAERSGDDRRVVGRGRAERRRCQPGGGGLPGLPGAGAPNLPGLGAPPGLPGFNPFKKP